MRGAYMKQLDLNLDDEPYEIKMDDIKMDDSEGKEKIQRKFKLNFEIVKKVDITIKFAIIGIIVSFIGSFFNFWGLKVEGIGRLDYGNLFNGYSLGGFLGIIFILSMITMLVLIYLKLKKYVLVADMVSIVVFLLQVIIILIWGKGSVDETFSTSIYFGSGFYICLLGIIITAVSTYFNFKKSIIKK